MANSPPTRVICFDVDGTLVEHPEHKTVWQLLNARYIVDADTPRDRYAAYLAGRITYREWVDLDIGDWVAQGAVRAEVESVIRENLRLVDGVAETLAELAARGYLLAIISGTLDITLDLLLEHQPFEARYTNRIRFHPRTGKIASYRATRFDGPGKALALERIAQRCGATVGECAFVGDHTNDIDVLEHAGTGVAFRPKDERVRAASDIVIDDGPLTRILDLFPEVRR